MRKIFTLFFAVALISFIGLPAAKAEEDTALNEPVLISEQIEACNGNQGLVVKRLNNDGVNAIPTVFVLGCYDTIHIFPNEQTYKTWWTDFEDISYVDGAYIADKKLEGNVTIRPGTYLVKQPSSPKVYAVEPGGVLRWIPDETTAEALYGKKWNTIILDLSDELFSDYTIGATLTTTAYPNGVLGYLPEGRVVYLSGTSYYNLPGSVMDPLRLESKFLVPLSAGVMATYTDGGDLAYDQAIAFPF
ncbi:MAG: hypothetical protein WC702_02705 [Patescibacteria group bacterium]|jgi:hypothetical protein